MALILASASPRRRDLLRAAGIRYDVDPVDVDERHLPGESAAAYVERLALLKANAGAERHPGRTVVAADTAVVVDETVFGKPADAAEAARMLRRLAGRPHDVLTGVAVVAPGRRVSRVERTTVWVAPIEEVEIHAYVATGEPLDKAGAYAIQGIGSRFVERISGSYSNVVGLPVATLVAMARSIDVELAVAGSASR